MFCGPETLAVCQLRLWILTPAEPRDGLLCGFEKKFRPFTVSMSAARGIFSCGIRIVYFLPTAPFSPVSNLGAFEIG